MFTKATVTALLAGAAAAYTPPTTGPSGNAINAPLIEIVPACKPYTIKWTPTLPTDGSPPNKVSLLLLKGPSSNVVFDSVIVEGIDNTGSFTWTPPSTVEATQGPGGYGIQLVVEGTGVFQYSTQFGFSKEACGAASSSASSSSVAPSSSAPAPSETPSGYAHSTPAPKPTSSASAYVTKSSSSAYETPAVNSTSAYISTSKYVAPPVGTGSPNTTVIYPTISMSVPETLKTSSTAAPSVAPQPSSFPGAASGLQAGLGLAGAIAALVAML